jgi:hypothetical protein
VTAIAQGLVYTGLAAHSQLPVREHLYTRVTFVRIVKVKAKVLEQVAQIGSLDGAVATVLRSVLDVVQVVDHLTRQL